MAHCKANCDDGYMPECPHIPCPVCNGPEGSATVKKTKIPMIKTEMTGVTINFHLTIPQMRKIFAYDAWVGDQMHMPTLLRVYEMVNKIDGVNDCDYSGHFGPRIIVDMCARGMNKRIEKIKVIILKAIAEMDELGIKE